jgi:hypothetical protein
MKILLVARLRLVAAGSLAILAIAAGTVHAKPKPSACPTLITACGCVITQPDIYMVANDLSASQTSASNCIEINAAGAILNVEGHKILGSGTGIGILINKSAANAIVEGGEEANNTPPQNPLGNPPESSSQGKVNLWDVGIEDDATGTIVALFADLGGSFLQSAGAAEPAGNTTAGLSLNGADSSFVGDFNANFNGKYGVIVTHSNSVTLANFSAVKNKDTGLRLDSSNRNAIGPAGASFNTNYGMLLVASSRNTIHDSNGNSFNGNAGIVMACGSGDGCPGGDGSNENRVANAGAPQNGGAGIVIQLGNLRNTVTITNNHDNGGPSDMIDLNPDCADNTWYNNVGTGNQSCIQ